MTARRPYPDRSRRILASERLLIVQHHQQSPAGPRHMGWAIVRSGYEELHLFLEEDGSWGWTASRRDAALFITRDLAERWAARNLPRMVRPVAVEFAR